MATTPTDQAGGDFTPKPVPNLPGPAPQPAPSAAYVPGGTIQPLAAAGGYGSYKDIPLISYTGAVILVGMPIIYFRNSGQQQWVTRYIFLISLMMIVYYSDALGRFSDFAKVIQSSLTGFSTVTKKAGASTPSGKVYAL